MPKDTVVSAIVQNKNRFLLIKRSKPPSENMYAFPGGKVEQGETLETAVLRELKEETCLVGHTPLLYAHYDLSSEGSYADLNVFKVMVDDTSPLKASDDAREADWFTIDETKQLPMPNSMIDCLTRLQTKG